MRIHAKYHQIFEYETDDVSLDWIIKEFGDIENYIEWECQSEYKKAMKIWKKKLMDYEICRATEEEKEKIDRMIKYKMDKEMIQDYYREIKF